MSDVVDVCVGRSIRRPAHKGGGLAIQWLIALREKLNVPQTSTLRVYDPHGECASLGPLRTK
jgi:hypothetical protein